MCSGGAQIVARVGHCTEFYTYATDPPKARTTTLPRIEECRGQLELHDCQSFVAGRRAVPVV